MEIFITIQDQLLSLNQSNIEEVSKNINSSVLVKSKKSLEQLLVILFKIIEARVSSMDLFAQIIYEIYNFPSFELKEFFKNKLLFLIFKKPLEWLDSRDKIIFLALARVLHSMRIFTDADIKKIMQNDNDFNNFWTVLIKVYFLDLLDDKSIIESSINAINKDVSDIKLCKNPSVFVSELENVRTMDSDILSKTISNGCRDDSIQQILKFDNISELQKISAMPEFVLNNEIKPSIFEHSSMLQNSPLQIFYAAFYGSIKCFKFLMLNDNNNSEKISGNGLSLENFAIAGGNFEIIRIIDQNKLNVSLCPQIACKYYRNTIFDWIVRTKVCNFKEESDIFGTVAAQCSVMDNIAVLEYLISQNIDLNMTSKGKFTPLHIAAIYHSLSVAQKLIRTPSVNINALTLQKQTVLHIAAKYNFPELIKDLRENSSIDVNALDLDNNTALHIATKFGNHECVSELLKFAGVDTQIKTNLGETAMMLSVTSGEELSIELFKEHNLFDPNDYTNSGYSLLHIAAAKGLADFVKYLLTFKDINVNKTSILGTTPLVLAIQNGQIEVIKILLEVENIDVYITDNFGRGSEFFVKQLKNNEIMNIFDDFIKTHPKK